MTDEEPKELDAGTVQVVRDAGGQEYVHKDAFDSLTGDVSTLRKRVSELESASAESVVIRAPEPDPELEAQELEEPEEEAEPEEPEEDDATRDRAATQSTKTGLIRGW